MSRILIVAALLMLAQQPMITRHDVPDQKYIDFADSLAVTNAVIKFSKTDIAGTLIAHDWILGAAHTIEYLEPGDTVLTAKDEPVLVESVVLHPGWIEDGRPEDIALVRLATTLDDLPIVDIYRGDDETGQEVVMIGNGDHGTGRTGPVGNDGQMRAATNRIDTASVNYLQWVFDDPAESDAATPMEGVSGPGDSSGPALILIDGTWTIVGVSSGQSTRATNGAEGRYGVREYYTRVSTYASWIDETLNPDDG